MSGYPKPSRQDINRKTDDSPSSKRRIAMTCTPGMKAQLLKRVFIINTPICEAYTGALNTIASIEDPVV
jgi:hypothetical protein